MLDSKPSDTNTMKSRYTLIASLAFGNDKLWAVVGCMGADGQPQIHAQTYVAMIDHGLDIQQAVQAPRWLSGRFALGEARDATAEVAYAIDNGDPETVEALMPEWRGTLFRVRLARLRVLERSRAAGRERAAVREEQHSRRPTRTGVSAVVATVLILGGAFLFTAGAVLVAWPVWAAGLALFAGGFVLYRP